MIETVVKISEKFPLLNIESGKTQKTFYSLGLNSNAKKYNTFSIIAGLFVLALMYGITGSAAMSVIFGIGIMLFLYYLPNIEKTKAENEMESELPLFLRDLGALINMGIPFVSSVSMLSVRKGTFNKEMGRVMKEVSKGASLISALAYLGSRIENTNVKRAIAQIISAYEQGGNGNELKRMGNDLLNAQRHKLKEYAAKSSIFSIFFIMTAVIAPTFYLIISIISPILFATETNMLQLTMVMMVIFPSISYLILAVGRMSMPSIAFRTKEALPKGLLFSIPLAFVFLLPIDIEYKLIILAMIFIASFLLFIKKYLEEIKISKVEANLPNALLLISSLPKGTHFNKVIERLAFSDLEGIREEFKKAYNQLKANLSPETVIKDIVERNKSPMLSKVMETMEYIYKAGGNVNERISEMTEDLLLFHDIKREQGSIMAIQKYSTMLGIILIPIVLSMAIQITGKMSGVMEKQLDLTFIIQGIIPAYLIINSGIISDFCSSLDVDKSKEMIYFSLLSLVSTGLFLVSLSLGII
ncbi:MAG: type II secretion system F family protein [Candidatus Micrarchaeota archaeon]|nr:type II secretion system F family protein [Candidatus Micrarchaeota archaeon]